MKRVRELEANEKRKENENENYNTGKRKLGKKEWKLNKNVAHWNVFFESEIKLCRQMELDFESNFSSTRAEQRSTRKKNGEDCNQEKSAMVFLYVFPPRPGNFRQAHTSCCCWWCQWPETHSRMERADAADAAAVLLCVFTTNEERLCFPKLDKMMPPPTMDGWMKSQNHRMNVEHFLVVHNSN